MAISKKTGREYQSRRERGHRVTKYPKGYDQWGMPIICGVPDADGNECLNTTSSSGCSTSTKRSEPRSWPVGVGNKRDRNETPTIYP